MESKFIVRYYINSENTNYFRERAVNSEFDWLCKHGLKDSLTNQGYSGCPIYQKWPDDNPYIQFNVIVPDEEWASIIGLRGHTVVYVKPYVSH